MLTPAENALLTRTGPGTEMGQYLRRFWQPVLLATELPAPDCPPVRVKLLGEALIAFRASDGQLGLIDEFCPHRRASLFYGRNEQCGLRCAYHGWQFDVNGRCMDMPSEPAEFGFKERVYTKAYPAREWGGLIWAYLGSAYQRPALPEFDWAVVPAGHRYVSKRLQESNYLQAVEGGIDSSHVSFLHSTPAAETHISSTLGLQSAYMWRDKAPRFTVNRTDYGLLIGARRDAEPDTYYWRITQFLLPTATIIPGAIGGEAPFNGHFWTPIDDERCWNYSISWLPGRPLTAAEIADLQSGASIHAGVDQQTYLPLRNKRNEYLLDRAAQHTTSFSGLSGVSEQDAAVQEGMGPIVDRSLEHLGTSDTAIIAARRLLLKECRALQAGHEPPATQKPYAYRVRSASLLLKRDVSYEETVTDALVRPVTPAGAAS